MLIKLERLVSGLILFVGQTDGRAVRIAAGRVGDLRVERGDLGNQRVDVAGTAGNLRVEVFSGLLNLLSELVDVARQRLPLQHGEITGGDVRGRIENVADAGEKIGQVGVDSGIAQLVHQPFELLIGLLLDCRAGGSRVCIAQFLLDKGVDLLGNARDFDTRALDDIADFYAGPRGVVDGFADVAGRVRVGNILPGDLQADLSGLQRVAGELNGAEERHGIGEALFFASVLSSLIPDDPPDRIWSSLP